MNISIDILKKDSNIRRNHLVLEDVVRQRGRESWLNETTTLLHDKIKTNKASSASQRNRQSDIFVAFN